MLVEKLPPLGGGAPEGGFECSNNLRRDADTPARECEEYRLLVLVTRERPGQLASRIGAILEWHLLTCRLQMLRREEPTPVHCSSYRVKFH